LNDPLIRKSLPELISKIGSRSEGNYHETTLLVQSIRYMPRLQLDRSALWVSWGNKIWSHPRYSDGTISRTTNRVLKGHTDDVARFVVKVRGPFLTAPLGAVFDPQG
jgi:hypothetical protein